jgi:hypothetical protein
MAQDKLSGGGEETACSPGCHAGMRMPETFSTLQRYSTASGYPSVLHLAARTTAIGEHLEVHGWFGPPPFTGNTPGIPVQGTSS